MSTRAFGAASALLSVFLATATSAETQGYEGRIAFDLNGAIWQGASISEEDQLRFMEDLEAFCTKMQVAVEPLSGLEKEWLDAVAPKTESNRGVRVDQDDPSKVERIFGSSAFVREIIINAATHCQGVTRTLIADFGVRTLSSRLGALIYVLANLELSKDALDTAARRGWLLSRAPGWGVEVEGRGWSSTITNGVTSTIMRISAFLARNT